MLERIFEPMPVIEEVVTCTHLSQILERYTVASVALGEEMPDEVIPTWCEGCQRRHALFRGLSNTDTHYAYNLMKAIGQMDESHRCTNMRRVDAG